MQVVQKKNRPSSAFLHDDLRATWQKKKTIKQTKNKQTNKPKDIKGPLNLQDTAYPFGDYWRRGCVRDGLCFLHNKSKYVRKPSACTVDPDVFGDDLKAQLFDFPASSNASAQADQLATCIGTVLNNHAPKRVVRPSASSKPKPHPWLTDRLKYLFQQRTHLHRKVRAYPAEQQLLQKYRAVRREGTLLDKKLKSEYSCTTSSSFAIDDATLGVSGRSWIHSPADSKCEWYRLHRYRT